MGDDDDADDDDNYVLVSGRSLPNFRNNSVLALLLFSFVWCSAILLISFPLTFFPADLNFYKNI